MIPFVAFSPFHVINLNFFSLTVVHRRMGDPAAHDGLGRASYWWRAQESQEVLHSEHLSHADARDDDLHMTVRFCQIFDSISIAGTISMQMNISLEADVPLEFISR